MAGSCEGDDDGGCDYGDPEGTYAEAKVRPLVSELV